MKTKIIVETNIIDRSVTFFYYCQNGFKYQKSYTTTTFRISYFPQIWEADHEFQLYLEITEHAEKNLDVRGLRNFFFLENHL